jgi:ribose transport system permease protein
MSRRSGTGRRRRFAIDEAGVLAGLAAMVAIVAIKDPTVLEVSSLVDLLRQSAFVGIMACGMVFLLAMREIDLSVGATYALSIVGAATFMSDGLDPWLAAALGLLIGAGLGAVNGLLANSLRVPTIVVTLGTLSMYRGIVLVWTDGAPVTGLDPEAGFFRVFGGDWLGIPAAGWVFAAVAIALTTLFTRTRFGVMVRAVGSNERVSELSGIPVDRVRLYALALVGLLCGIAGMLTLAYFQTADPTLGTGVELQVIAAAIIGGTSLAGGSGTVFGAMIGALLIQFITTGLVRFEVPANWSGFVTGAIIVIAVALDGLVRRRRAARRREAQGALGDEDPPAAPGGAPAVPAEAVGKR